MLGEIKKRVISICYFLRRIHSGVTAYLRLQLRGLVSAVDLQFIGGRKPPFESHKSKSAREKEIDQKKVGKFVITSVFSHFNSFN